jgi:transcription elongation factor GreA
MTQKDFHFTSEGLKELRAELKKLVEGKKPKLIDRVAVARSHGDLSENSEYTAAREDLAFVEGRIEELEELIAKAKIIKNKKTDKTDKKLIKLGSKVTVKVNGKNHTYELVGEWEADPTEKKISHTSPLGKALMGKKKDEKIKIEAPAGKVTYHIQKIH